MGSRARLSRRAVAKAISCRYQLVTVCVMYSLSGAIGCERSDLPPVRQRNDSGARPVSRPATAPHRALGSTPIGLRQPILRGRYATLGMSYVVQDYDKARGRGVVQIASNRGNAGLPISELIVLVDGEIQTVLVDRNMPVSYEPQAVRALFYHWGTEEARSELIDAVRRAGEEWNRRSGAETRGK